MSYSNIASKLGRESIPYLLSPPRVAKPLASVPAAPLTSASLGVRATTRIEAAYARLVERHRSPHVFISALAEEAGLPVPTIQSYILSHPAARLNEGDWSYASPAQRAAAMLHRDRRRLYVAFPPR